MMSGARTCAEFHGNWIPPHVRPSSADVELPMMRMFPLEMRGQRGVHATRSSTAYIQSIRESRSESGAWGVFKLRKSRQSTIEIPVRGRFKSTLVLSTGTILRLYMG